jgi:hypothetical protein
MLQNGEVIGGRFRVERLLGQGGMSCVFLGRHLELDRPVALKEIVLLSLPDSQQTSVMRGAYSEARILSRLSHPRLPRVHDFFRHGPHYYIVLDYIEGEPLDEYLLRRGPRSPGEVLAWADEICEVLEYLHGQSPPVIFRDLKPSNVLLLADGHVKLIDFGIAKLFDVESGGGTLSLLRGTLTHGFAPPEQYTGGTDARTDLYALGATLYNLLSGQVPSEAGARVAGDTPLEPLRTLAPGVSAELAACIEKMLALQPAERPQTASEVRAELGRLRSGGKRAERVAADAATPAVKTGGPGFPPVDVLHAAPARDFALARVRCSGLAALVVIVLLLAWSWMQHSPARLTVESDPAGAHVFIDDVERGVTPLQGLSLERGTHRLELRGSAHQTLKQPLEVAAGETRSVFVRLPPK